MDCCALTSDNVSTECNLNHVNEPLAERVRRLKSNPYMTKEIWQAKTIYIIDTDKWYSYADIDQLINN